MTTNLHTFINIFDSIVEENGNFVKLKRIIIPIIQRDYAQGRKSPDVSRIRERFLESLYQGVTVKPITLDFIYGDIDDNGTMTPLDGQQRLTTLFLLHWYAAKKDNISIEEFGVLNKFSYETRYSARDFCRDLLKHRPSFTTEISKEIINQVWFPLDWEMDPTISSMLVMLDAIDKKFRDVPGLWDKLKDGCITFYFLPIKDMGLTDELYIKMNSRGKPLTAFEHFKAELERKLCIIDEKIANRIIRKIDREWTELLWQYRDSEVESFEDSIIDDEFLRYFKFICDIICYRENQSPLSRSDDEFDLLDQYFSPDSLNVVKNIDAFERFFDCWLVIPGYKSPTEFLHSFMSIRHEAGKIVIGSEKVDILGDCLSSYGEKRGKIRQFPLNRMVLLYAITVYLQNTAKVAELDFKRRIRIVNNLIQNSEYEIADRIDRNRMPAILEATEAIILTGKLDKVPENSFNSNQMAEERNKIEYLESEPDMAEVLFALEDHELLYGQISILGLENLAYSKRFQSLFSCDWDKVNCAMMAIGDYSQRERNKWRYQFGSTVDFSWKSLFHKSSNDGFENTRQVLVNLLSRHKEFSNDILNNIANKYLKECEDRSEFPFRYYYIKYKEFRPGFYGKMRNNNVEANPYSYLVMQTKTQVSENSYYPYLKIVSEENLSKDDFGQRLIFGDEHIICTNNSYEIRKNENNSVIRELFIKQNSDGIDTEDRVIKLKQYIEAKYIK
jgi:hypothetical protein